MRMASFQHQKFLDPALAYGTARGYNLTRFRRRHAQGVCRRTFVKLRSQMVANIIW